MDTFDRYRLAIALLDGDRATRQVLADLLVEQGDETLAAFCRRTRSSREGDLDIALRMLPATSAIALACDFFEHASRPWLTDIGHLHQHSRDELRETFDQLRQRATDTRKSSCLKIFSTSVLRAEGQYRTDKLGAAVTWAARTLRDKCPRGELQWQIAQTRRMLEALLVLGQPAN